MKPLALGFVAAIAAAAHIAFAAWPAAAEAAKPAAVVRMEDDQLSFIPAKVTIKAGQTVEWKNSSREVHNVVADPGKATDPKDIELPKGARPFASGFLQPGQTFFHTFETPGTYRYVCSLHEVEHMTGEVIVTP